MGERVQAGQFLLDRAHIAAAEGRLADGVPLGLESASVFAG
jgi:hypothetical protein